VTEGTHFICGTCARTSQVAGPCDTCASDSWFRSQDGYIIEFPMGMSCMGCGLDGEPLSFRGWSNVMGLFFWARESQTSGYVCPNCALKRSAVNLAITAVAGWLSFAGVFFYAWRSTYRNFVSITSSPASPAHWGALSDSELLEVLNQAFAEDQGFADEGAYESADFIDGSPLEDLTVGERKLVLQAEGLYEVLRVSSTASTSELKAAYRQRAKELHPDLQTEGGHAEIDEMVVVNHAWAILKEEHLRRAYDWKLTRV
jgi:hypothetical protein